MCHGVCGPTMGCSGGAGTQAGGKFHLQHHPAQLLGELVSSSTTPRALPWQEETSGGSHTSPASPEEGEMPGPLSGFLCLCLTARPKGTKPHTPCQRGTWEPGTFPGSRGALMGLGGKVWGGFPLEQQFPLYLSSSLSRTLLGFYQS